MDERGSFGRRVDPMVGKATQFPHQKSEGRGRKKLKPFREILEELAAQDYKMQIDKEICNPVYDKAGKLSHYELTLPNDQILAMTMQAKSIKDVKWLEQLIKVRGLQAPTKIAETDSEGNDKIPTAITVTVVR